jgi:hypothetical protein
MSGPVEAERYLAHLLALRLTGEPLMCEGTSPLDGRTVVHRSEAEPYEHTGVVVGPAQIPEFVWVRWEPTGLMGLHRITDLIEQKKEETND